MLRNRILPMSEEVKEHVRRFAEQVTGHQVRDTHINKLQVHAFSDRIKREVDSCICVGKEMDCNLSCAPHEPVLAIFEDEQHEYLVITPNPNHEEGTVYFFDPQQVSAVERESS
jgi:hypothetical protein